MQHAKEPAPSYRNLQRVVMCAVTLAAAILIAGAALTPILRKQRQRQIR